MTATKAPGKHYRKGITLVEAIQQFGNDESAHEWLLNARWPEGVRCAYCEGDRINTRTGKRLTRQFHCKECEKNFTVKTGTPGILSFMLIAGLWGLIFNGFPYAIAFKTGNVAAVNMSFMLFFPFLFMTTLFIPQEQMSPWLSRVADYNPVTYILAAGRSLISEGWQLAEIRDGILATLAVGVLSIGLALAALKGRATRK